MRSGGNHSDRYRIRATYGELAQEHPHAVAARSGSRWTTTNSISEASAWSPFRTHYRHLVATPNNHTNVDTNAYANGSHNSRASRISSQHVVPWQRRRTLHVVARVPDELLRVSPLLRHLAISARSGSILYSRSLAGTGSQPAKTVSATILPTMSRCAAGMRSG